MLLSKGYEDSSPGVPGLNTQDCVGASFHQLLHHAEIFVLGIDHLTADKIVPKKFIVLRFWDRITQDANQGPG